MPPVGLVHRGPAPDVAGVGSVSMATEEGNHDEELGVDPPMTVATASSVLEGETGDQIFNRLVLPEVDVM